MSTDSRIEALDRLVSIVGVPVKKFNPERYMEIVDTESLNFRLQHQIGVDEIISTSAIFAHLLTPANQNESSALYQTSFAIYSAIIGRVSEEDAKNICSLTNMTQVLDDLKGHLIVPSSSHYINLITLDMQLSEEVRFHIKKMALLGIFFEGIHPKLVAYSAVYLFHLSRELVIPRLSLSYEECLPTIGTLCKAFKSNVKIVMELGLKMGSAIKLVQDGLPDVVNVEDTDDLITGEPGLRIEKGFVSSPYGKIGVGSSGVVLKHKDEHGNFIAIKTQELSLTNSNGKMMSLMELAILATYTHPNIVSGHSFNVITSRSNLLRAQKIQIHMEYMSQNLEYFLGINSVSVTEWKSVVFDGVRLKEPILSAIDKTKISRQILNAVVFLHNNFVYHLDIKPENILLNTDGDEITVKLTDFGLSVPLNNIAPVPSMLSSRKTGTVLYMPPEINISSSPSIYYTDAIDVWSLGCVIAEIELEVRLFDMNDEIASRMNLSYTYATEPIEAAMILTYVILGTPTAETWPGFNETNRTLIGSYTPHLKWLDKLCTQESKTAIPMCLKYYQFDRPTAREILDIYS